MECPLCGDSRTRVFLGASEDSLEGRSYFECALCRLVFLSPDLRLSGEEEKKRYDLHCNSPEDEGYLRFLSRLTEPLTRILPPGSEGLDYGCGPGPALSVLLSRSGFKTADYDPYYYPDQTLLQKKYDFITCTETAEHFYFPGREFARLAGLLRSGGCLAVMTEFLRADRSFLHWPYRRDPSHVCFYAQDTFHFIARRHGWKPCFPAPNVVFFAV